MSIVRSSLSATKVIESLLVASMSVALGFGLVTDERIALVVVVGMIMLLALMRPFGGFVLLVVGAFSVQWLITLGLLPDTADLALDALALVLTAAILLRLVRGSGVGPLSTCLRWLVAFLLVALLSGVVNGSSPLAGVLGMRLYVRYVPLLLVPAVFGWSESAGKSVVRLIVILLLVQVPVAVAQFLLRTVATGDVIGGTIGGSSSGVLTVITIAGSTLFAAFLIYRAASWPAALAGLVAMCVPPALNETKIFFVAAPLVWASTIVPRIGRNLMGSLLIIAAITAGFVGVYQSYTTVYGDWFASQGSVQAAFSSQISAGPVEGGVMNRIPQVIFAAGTIARSPRTLLFGFGPGSLTRSDQAGVRGVLIQEYGPLLRNTVFLGRVMLEYGLLGLICFAALVVSVFRIGRQLERGSDDSLARAFGMGMQGTVITFSLLSIYTSTFISDAPACMLWAFAGVAALAVSQLTPAVPEASGE